MANHDLLIKEYWMDPVELPEPFNVAGVPVRIEVYEGIPGRAQFAYAAQATWQADSITHQNIGYGASFTRAVADALVSVMQRLLFR